jgi:hypothetical protein
MSGDGHVDVAEIFLSKWWNNGMQSNDEEK